MDREWFADDLCLIEKHTGVKLYGTVCTDMTFIAKQLNEKEETINFLKEKIKEIENTKYKCKLCRLESKINKGFEKLGD